MGNYLLIICDLNDLLNRDFSPTGFISTSVISFSSWVSIFIYRRGHYSKVRDLDRYVSRIGLGFKRRYTVIVGQE